MASQVGPADQVRPHAFTGAEAAARGAPARVAAVIVHQDKVAYTDWEPSKDVLQAFSYREDNQIMGLELLAIVIGPTTFSDILQNHNVRVWTDNAGASISRRLQN